MLKTEYRVDMSGALKKQATLREIPQAFLSQANSWASETIRYIKQRIRTGGGYFRREPREIAQRLNYRVDRLSESSLSILLGTGRYIGREEVVYARIQDEGGTILPKRRKFLTIPFAGVKGSSAMWRSKGSFIAHSRSGGLFIAMKSGKRGRLVPLFLLSKQATLPPRRWWTNSIAERMPQLRSMMASEAVLKKAESMRSV